MQIVLQDNRALPPITLIPAGDNGGEVRILSPVPVTTYVTLAELFRGPQGLQGPQGIQGPPGASGGLFVTETPSGAFDGVNTTFALAHTPVTDSLLLFYNGVFMTIEDDYTLTGPTLTTLFIPHNGDKLRAYYQV